MNTETQIANHERTVAVLSGWLMLPLLIVLLIADVFLLIYSVPLRDGHNQPPIWGLFVPMLVLLPVISVSLSGLFTLQPNEARVLILFGAYKGTVRSPGFHWANPFYAKGLKQRISMRARTLNMAPLKVNDKGGNPIEIAAVVVWRVQDTGQAAFDVENYESYVQTQSESSLRHLASSYAYDHGEVNEITLRSGVDEVSQALRKELQDRLEKAGVLVDETRLTHLAYAPEIAQAMLRRQQAEAVIAARRKIVEGAVSMVDMALKELTAKQVVQLDDERKASMVSNLMVVLCGEAEVHPVVNTGTLYN